MCMLNGRNSVNNDFTSVSTKGLSVVDYCVVCHDDISVFQEFSVVRTTDLVNRTGNADILAATNIPDHSMLQWKIERKELTNCYSESPDSIEIKSYDFEVNSVPD